MQNLLSSITYNYLPLDWTSLLAAINQTSTSYSALSASIQSNLAGQRRFEHITGGHAVAG